MTSLVYAIHHTILAITILGEGQRTLHVEYAERRRQSGILFIASLFCDYSNLEYVRGPVIYRVNQAEYVIHVLVAASQE